MLFSIVQESATPLWQRRRAASELAQYFLPKKPSQKKSRRGNFAPDQYGFVVDPNEARELRDTKLAPHHLSDFKSERSWTPKPDRSLVLTRSYSASSHGSVGSFKR